MDDRGLEDDLRWLRQSALAPTLARLCDRARDIDGAVLRPAAPDGFFVASPTALPADFNAALRRSESYLDLFAVDKLHAFLRVDPHASVVAALQDGPLAGVADDGYEALRAVQNRTWAQETVAAGVKQAKDEGKYDEAILLYKKALEIDPTCADAFVARGAAYANKGRLERAVQDFESALKVDPSHKNALKYLEATRQKHDEDRAEKQAAHHARLLSSSSSSTSAAALAGGVHTVRYSLMLHKGAWVYSEMPQMLFDTGIDRFREELESSSSKHKKKDKKKDKKHKHEKSKKSKKHRRRDSDDEHNDDDRHRRKSREADDFHGSDLADQRAPASAENPDRARRKSYDDDDRSRRKDRDDDDRSRRKSHGDGDDRTHGTRRHRSRDNSRERDRRRSRDRSRDNGSDADNGRPSKRHRHSSDDSDDSGSDSE